MYAFFVSLIVVVIASICRGLHDNNCDVVPKDQYIEVGSSIEILCLTSCVNDTFFWTLDSRHVDKSLSKTINSTHMVLLLTNFTHSSATVECHSNQTQQVIGGTTVKTYSKPGKISCLLHYRDLDATGMDQDFTCTWEHQTDSAMKINYTVFLDFSSLSTNGICRSHDRICTCENQSAVFEIWTSSSSIIIIRARTDAWEAYSDPYEFKPLHIYKINYPTVIVTAFSDHLLVVWKARHPVFRSNYNCQVKSYKTSLSTEETPKILNISQISEVSGNVSIKEVESCMNYIVSVRCAVDMAVWSNWSPGTTVLTKLNKKHVRTRMWRKVSKMAINEKRKVHIMWADIPPTCEETVCYTVKQVPYKDDMAGENYTCTLCGNTSCDVDVDKHAHQMHLIASHNNAVIAEDSIYVPAVDESLIRVTDIQTASQEGNIEVSWKAPDRPVSGYMIDWTHDGLVYYWKETKLTNATLFELLGKKPCNITITPLLYNRTGDSTQAPQICSSDGGNTTRSSMHLIKTRFADQWLIVWICVFGVTIVLVVVSLGAYCAIQWKKFREKLVPNPGLSSLGTWLPWSQQKEGYFQPFSEPSKDICDQVYTEETHRASTPSLAADCNGNAARDRYTHVFSYSVVTPLSEVNDDNLAKLTDTLFSSTGEPTTFLFTESILVSPYRSQSVLENPMSTTGEENKQASGNQQDKMTMKTVYVSLDVLEQDNAR